jgi:nitrogen fixation protein FixH
MNLLLALLVSTGVMCAEAAPDWKITAEPPAKLRANFDMTMKIKVEDGKGKPVSGATVEMVLTMVDMDHGEHKTPAKMIAPGIYEGKANFFMVGGWNLEVRVKKGKLEKAQKIRIDVKE